MSLCFAWTLLLPVTLAVTTVPFGRPTARWEHDDPSRPLHLPVVARMDLVAPPLQHEWTEHVPNFLAAPRPVSGTSHPIRQPAETWRSATHTRGAPPAPLAPPPGQTERRPMAD